jgi:hypothetical protein
MAKINEYPLERFTFGDDDYYDIDYWDGAVYQSAKIKGSTIRAAMSGGGSILAADGQVMPADRSQDLANFKLSLRDGVFTLGTVDADFGSIFQATKDSGNTYATIKTKTNDNAALILDINTADVTGAGNKTAFIQFRDAGVSKYIFGTNTDGVANFSDNSFFISSSAQLTDYIQAIDRDTESFVIGRQVGNPLNDNTKFLINNGNSFDTTELNNVLMLSSRDESKKWSVDKDMVMSHTKAQSLELTATDRGLLLNRVTTAQMNGIASPTTNEIVYNTDLNGLYRYDGAAWVGLSAGYGLLSVTDSSGTPTFYATLKSAVDAIGGNGVVNIHSDITLTSSADEITSFSSFDTLTINGNGYTITHTSNTGDEFSILNSTASGTNPTALYLNNIKIISNGSGTGSSSTVFFGGSRASRLIQLSEDSRIEATNNRICDRTTIRGGTLIATNSYVVFGGTIENAKVTTKFGLGSFKNCEITINTGGEIGFGESAGEISNCIITCDADTNAPIQNITNNCKFWNNTVICTSGSNNCIEMRSGGAGNFIPIYGNKVYHYGSGRAFSGGYISDVHNCYFYAAGNEALYVLRVYKPQSGTNIKNVTCVTGSDSHVAFRDHQGSPGNGLSMKNVDAICTNAANTEPAMSINIRATDGDQYMRDCYAEVANPLVKNIEFTGDGTVYIYNSLLSEVGDGINYGTVTLGNTNTLDAYGNGQIG